eukprot:225778-Chlamydomonas_euryale.AAC.1
MRFATRHSDAVADVRIMFLVKFVIVQWPAGATHRSAGHTALLLKGLGPRHIILLCDAAFASVLHTLNRIWQPTAAIASSRKLMRIEYLLSSRPCAQVACGDVKYERRCAFCIR